MATDPACLTALRTLVAVFDRRGILYALVGGTAVQFVYGVVAARFTADIDTMVLVRSLEEFYAVQAELEAEGWQRGQEPYRMLALSGCRIDILPYSEREVEGERIRFPGSQTVLSVVGWLEAIMAAGSIEIPGIGVVRVPPAENLAALKAAAWHERGGATSKDAYDLVVLARRFGEDDAVLEFLGDGIAASAVEARAMLLARKVKTAVPAATERLRHLASNLTEPRTGLASRLWSDWERAAEQEDVEQEIQAVGQGLLTGLQDQ